MPSDPEEFEDGGGDRQVSIDQVSSGPIAVGGHSSVTVGPMSPEGPTEGLLRAVHEVREDLTRVRPDVLDSSLNGILARAESQVERAGELPLPLARLLRSHLMRSSIAPLFSSALRLAELLAEYAEPDAESDEDIVVLDSHMPAPPQDAVYGTRPGTPAKHTPPGPGTGSDDDEWPDPVDG
ncbi:hypothetical protein QD712_13240 [Streptomyces acidiscabies]|uniref:hypothetical protein n=1 Tax=Streptomyces acidiscabies TaxID=42234 RepID=UPI0030D0046F